MSPRLRSGDPLRHGTDGAFGDPDHRKTHPLDSLDGYRVEYPTGGFSRPEHVVENVEEIELRFDGSGRAMRMECGYCGDPHRTRSFDDAIRWWRAHDCATLALAEQTAIVYDLAARGLGVEHKRAA